MHIYVYMCTQMLRIRSPFGLKPNVRLSSSTTLVTSPVPARPNSRAKDW